MLRLVVEFGFAPSAEMERFIGFGSFAISDNFANPILRAPDLLRNVPLRPAFVGEGENYKKRPHPQRSLIAAHLSRPSRRARGF